MGKAWSTNLRGAAHHRGSSAARTRARVHAGARGQDRAAGRSRHRAGRALVRRATADAVAVACQGLNQSGRHRQEQHADQPAPGHRPDRRPGAGPLSLTGQPNAMGGREVAASPTAERAPRPGQRRAPRRGGAPVGVPTCRRSRASRRWMFEAAAEGQVKALWIACTNPLHSLPDQAMVRRALQTRRVRRAQDACATTATAAAADWLLPAATWGEEGRHRDQQRASSAACARAVPAPGQAREDWRIAVDAARRLETAGAPAHRRRHAVPLPVAEAVWNEHRETTRDRDLDITGLSLVHARGSAAALAAPRPKPRPPAPLRRPPLRHARRPRTFHVVPWPGGRGRAA